MGRDWELVHFALDTSDWWLAARDLQSGDDFTCTPDQAICLRPFLHARGLDAVCDDGRVYVMTFSESANLGPAGPAYGSHPLEELQADPAGFLPFLDDEEELTVPLRGGR